MKTLKFLPALFLFFFACWIARPTEAFAGASLSFSPANQTITVGDNFEVEVILDTGGAKTDGVDIIISYDDLRLSAASVDLSGLYDNKINQDVSQPGKIVIQAVNDIGSSFAGTGILAKINFKAIAGGLAEVSFDMGAGASLDTNVNSKGEDILTGASDAVYTVLPMGIGGDDATVSGTPTPTSLTPTPTVSLPASGWLEPTMITLGIGGILVVVSLSLLALL